MNIAIALALTALLVACSSQRISAPAAEKELTQCPEQRPQICTMIYQPVCATRDTGVRCVTTPCPSHELKTYSNNCSACADSAVAAYVPGECEPDITQ